MQLLNYILLNKLYVSILAIPMLSHMLYDFFQRGMIFKLYGNFVFKEDYYNESINEKQDAIRKQIENAEPNEDVNVLLEEINTLQLQKIETPAYKKPLGNCLKCFHVWIVIIWTVIFTLYLFGIHWVSFLEINLFKWILALSFSYFILVYNHYK